MPSGTIGSATGANNVTGVAADYTSVANWEAAIDGNNQTGTVIYIAGAIDSSTVTLDAAYTGMLLTAHADAAVNAPTYAAATSRARISVGGGGNDSCLYVTGDGWTVEKLALIQPSVSANRCFRVQLTGTVYLRRCVLVGTDYIQLHNQGGTCVASNCAFFGSALYAGHNATFYHCSASSASIGFNESACYGCVVQTASTCYGSCTGDYNVSEDATAPGSASTKYARSTSGWFTNTSAGTEDLSLVAGKQGWWASNKDAIDQTGWPGDVATDIVGTSRAAPIDPGVWQTPAAAASGNPWYYYASQAAAVD